MRNIRKAAFLLSVVILTGAVSAASDSYVVSATSGTQQQIDQTEQEKKDLENKLNQNEQELNGLKNEQKNLKGELDNLNQQLTQVVERLEELEQQIGDKEQEIADTQAALTEARATEAWQYECMVANVRYMYENSDDSFINSLFKQKSLSEMLNAADYIERIAAYDRELMDEYTANREYIEQEEARLQKEKIELDNLKVQAEAERSKVSGLISQTSNAIAQYADEIEEAERKAEEYEAELKKKEEDLEYLKKKLAEEIALSQAAANAAWRDISEVSFAEGDRYLLANLIYCEAGGEPYAGKLAVGSVVMNRVLSSRFPNTIVGVIYAHGQFSPVASGRLDIALAANKANAECYKAADEAMAGATNVGNCLFFRTPIPGLTGISIGGHIFY
ncbi:MAG: cell wall hydrolase [Acetatifactor sp.]